MRDPFAAPQWTVADPVLVTTGRPAPYTHPNTPEIERAWTHAKYRCLLAGACRVEEPDAEIEDLPIVVTVTDGPSTWAEQERESVERFG